MTYIPDPEQNDRVPQMSSLVVVVLLILNPLTGMQGSPPSIYASRRLVDIAGVVVGQRLVWLCFAALLAALKKQLHSRERNGP